MVCEIQLTNFHRLLERKLLISGVLLFGDSQFYPYCPSLHQYETSVILISQLSITSVATLGLYSLQKLRPSYGYISPHYTMRANSVEYFGFFKERF